MEDSTPPGGRGEPQNNKWYEKPQYQILLFVSGILLFGLVLFFALNSYIEPKTSTQKKDLVQALGLITAGVAGAVGIFFTWRGQRITQRDQERNQSNTLAQLANAQEQLRQARKFQEDNQRNTQAQLTQSRNELEINREGQITDRFTRAIEQLGASEDGEKKVEIRLGGIYALERIARDSERDCWTIAEVLSGYIRQNARWLEGKLSPHEDSKLSSQREDYKYVEYQHRHLDIQAALDVIKVLLEQCQRPKGKKALGRLYLSRTDLSFGDLRETNLEEARFRNANLWGIRLDKSILRRAHLRGAILKGANLRGTNFEEAGLEGATSSQLTLKEPTWRRHGFRRQFSRGLTFTRRPLVMHSCTEQIFKVQSTLPRSS